MTHVKRIEAATSLEEKQELINARDVEIKRISYGQDIERWPRRTIVLPEILWTATAATTSVVACPYGVLAAHIWLRSRMVLGPLPY